jgi:hypothetical protein
MTTFTDLSAGAVGVGGIPSGSTVTALRDNPLAIAEGATGAPRIYGLAAATEGDGLPIVTISAANTLQILEGLGFTQLIFGYFTTNTLVTALRFTVPSYNGSARFRVDFTRGIDSGSRLTTFNWYWKIDGVTSQSGAFDPTNSAVTLIRDVSFSAGDEVTFEIDIIDSRGDGLRVDSAPVTADNGYVVQTLFKLNSE